MDEEIWKPIPGIDGYEVSSLGNVRSFRRKVVCMLKPSISSGYRGVNVGEWKYVKVAKLVMLTFVGPVPDGMEICHNNGIRTDDRLINLRYDTHAANIQDAIKHNGGIWHLRKDTVKPKKRHYIKRDDFIESVNSSYSVDEAADKLGITKKTLMEDASRLRKLGYKLKYYENRGKYGGSNVSKVSRTRELSVLLALEAGEITEENAINTLGIDNLNLRAMRIDSIAYGIKMVKKSLKQELPNEVSR